MKTITMIAVGIFMIFPAMVSAEEMSDGNTGTTPPSPMLYDESGASGVEQGGEAGRGTLIKHPMLLRESPTKSEVRAPRDSASGLPTGRVMASGTRPLPQKLEERMEKRDMMMGSNTPMMERREDRKENRDERQDVRKDAREDRRDDRQDRRQELLKRMTTQMVSVMEAAVERFTKLAERIDSRIAKLREKNVDTSIAEANLATARAKITEATTAINLVKETIANVDSSTASSTDESTVKSVRDALQKARASIEAARKALVLTVESLKAKVKIETNASTTSTTP